MAKSKKPRKKYHSNKMLQSKGIDSRDLGMSSSQINQMMVNGAAHRALIRNSTEPLSDAQVSACLFPVQNFLDLTNAGKCTNDDYLKMMDENYQYLRLINELCQHRLANDDWEHMLICLELEERSKTNQDLMLETLTSIGERFNKLGKWGVNAKERAVIQGELLNYKEALNIATEGIHCRAREAANAWLMEVYKQQYKREQAA